MKTELSMGDKKRISDRSVAWADEQYEIELLQQVAELTKENEDAKFWAEEQAKGLNAAADRNAELSSELTKANHNILALTEQVEHWKDVAMTVQGHMSSTIEELSRLRDREQQLVEALKKRLAGTSYSFEREFIESLLNNQPDEK